MIDKKMYIFSVKLSIFIVLFLIFFSNLTFAQYSKPTLKKKPYNSKKINQVQSMILKANRYESLSEYGKSYTLYRSLIRTNSTNLNVLNGYVRNSVKTKKIKECEIKLKALISTSKKKTETDIEIIFESFLGQLFLMTDRNMQGNEIIKIINASDVLSRLKFSLKGRMYYESLSYKNAIDQYMKARKELKDNELFSKELFKTFKSANMISEATNELVNIFLKEDNKLNREKRFDMFSAKHEMIKLFELEDNRNSMIKVVAGRTNKDKSLNNLLSELYFMNRDYENSFLALKKLDIEENESSIIISFATKLFKEKDYKNSANFYSLFFTEDKQIQKKELKQYFYYIDALVKLDQLENSMEKLSVLDFPEAKIKLAYLNHLSGNWKKSKKIYEKQIDILKDAPNGFVDYLNLLISLKDFSRSQELINIVLKDSEYNLLRKEIEDQLLYLDILLSVLQQNKKEFLLKYDNLVKDRVISDSDNNIIKIKNELGLIGDDEELLKSYLDYLSYQIDLTNKFEIRPIKADNIEDKAKKLFVLKLNYYYLKAEKKYNEQSNIIKVILSEEPSESEIGSLILDYCMNEKISKEEKNKILMSLLKGEFSDLIKSKARKIIRQK